MTAWKLAGAALAAGALAAGAVAPEMAPELLLGLTAPLAAAVLTHLHVARTWRQDPGRVTGALIRLFIAKLVAFGAYIAVVVRGLNVDVVPFMLSFIVCFAVLHVAEAAHLRRLAAA